MPGIFLGLKFQTCVFFWVCNMKLRWTPPRHVYFEYPPGAIWSFEKRLKALTSQGGPHKPQLNPVSVAWSNWEHCYSPLNGMLVHRRLTPSSMSPVPIYAPGWRETLWGKVSCLRKQHHGRDWESNHLPSDLKSNALTTKHHHAPMKNALLPTQCLVSLLQNVFFTNLCNTII